MIISTFRSYWLWFALISIEICTISCSLEKPENPNILFIAVDDLRTDLGCYGNTLIKTPNMDRLAESGLLFSRAYCQQAVCNPSRASLLTGMRPDAIKVWNLQTHFREAVPDIVTLPQYFKQNGYTVEGMGKIFHGTLKDPQSWSHPKKEPVGHSLYPDTAMRRLEERRDVLRAQGVPENQIGGKYRGPGVMSVDEPDNKRFDGALTDLAIEVMADIQEPFFLAVGYHRPHLPFVAPKKYFDLYDPHKIPLAPNPYLPEGSPDIAMNTMYELRAYEDFAFTPTPFEGSLTLEQRKRLKHGYYASVSFIDAQIGRLIAALDDYELDKNTIVILWGDHGWKLGEHNSWGKMTNYENDTHVPLIIHIPWLQRGGSITDGFVEFVDIYPSLCELAGLDIPEHLEGFSFVPLIDHPDREWKSAAFSQYMRWYNPEQPWKTTVFNEYMQKHDADTFMGYAMRTDRYRYVEWKNMKNGDVVSRELFDHQADPQENTNVAEVSGNKDVVSKLSQKLNKGWRAALPIDKKQK